MATTFDVIINQDDADETYAAQAAQAVFQEIARLEDELSRFRASSDIYRLGQLKAGESILVGMAAWDCLALAKAMHEETQRRLRHHHRPADEPCLSPTAASPVRSAKTCLIRRVRSSAATASNSKKTPCASP
jgi:hypothetical protein